MDEHSISFNCPHMTGKELYYIANAHFCGKLAGDGPFTKFCHAWLEDHIGCRAALLTHSCTAALEMMALLLDIQPGDEVIMPSYTFVSTANAFVLRGGVPVFVDIRPDTLNLDETLIEEAVTPRTRAIVPVHYAGVACEMDAVADVARRHDLAVLEDAAQGLQAGYKGRPLGSLGDLAALSFHETKNLISGEGGALLINNPQYLRQAEIIREKGTDRSRFFRGEVDKYTWQSPGSSYLPGELIAAFLRAQFEEAGSIAARRQSAWAHYHALLAPLEERGLLLRPLVPEHCEHNAHMYYVVLNKAALRDSVLAYLKSRGVHAVFHYVPLHASPAGRRYARVHGSMARTEDLSARLIRLPLWIGLGEDQQEYIVQTLSEALQC